MFDNFVITVAEALQSFRTWWAGSWRSLTIAFNALVGAIAGVLAVMPDLSQELVNGLLSTPMLQQHVQSLLGPRLYAGLMIATSVVNILLRFRTSESLAQKGARAMARGP